MQIPPFFVRIPGGSGWIAKDEDIFFWIFQMGILRGIWPFIDELETEMGFKTFQNFSTQMEQFPRPSYCVWNPAPEVYDTLRCITQGQTQKCEANHHLLDELGSLSHYLPFFFTSQVVVWDFFHQEDDLRFPAYIPGKKQKSWGWGALAWLEIRDQPDFDPRNHPILKCELKLGMQHLDTAIYKDKRGDGHARLQICPLYIFGNKAAVPMVFKDLNIGETRVWRLDSGPNLQPWHGTGTFRLFSPPLPGHCMWWWYVRGGNGGDLPLIQGVFWNHHHPLARPS